MYKILRKPNNTWEAQDTSHDFSVTFVEGLYNETQQSQSPEWLTDPSVLAGLHRHLADWCANNYRNLCTCNVALRKSVLSKLNKPLWWEVLAGLDSGMLRLLSAIPTADGLTSAIRLTLDDTTKGTPKINLDEAAQLLDVCSDMPNEEIAEIQTILQNRLIEPQSVSAWAKSLLKWTSQIVEDKPFEGLVRVIRNVMKEKGINQQRLSQMTGIHPTNINKFLTCKSVPRIDTVITIAEAIGMEVRLNRK